MRTVLSVIAAMALVGCASISSTIPAQLLVCATQPAAPAAGTQRDVALYIVDLAVAGDDCRTKLGSVSRILTPENK